MILTSFGFSLLHVIATAVQHAIMHCMGCGGVGPC